MGKSNSVLSVLFFSKKFWANSFAPVANKKIKGPIVRACQAQPNDA
jgi:hypothetical protein